MPIRKISKTVAANNDRSIAAIDLGSNSFHMVIAEQTHQAHQGSGSLQFIDRVKEMVRLNAGLDANDNLSIASQQRALDCLGRFRQRLGNIPTEQVRAVGTNTFRAARNAGQFLAKAEAALGQRIAIISGHEEARLIYRGAAFSLESSGRRRLVIDVGGGSTELIIGKGNKAISMSSLYMGCVSMSRRFFKDGMITAQRLQHAKDAALLELSPVIAQYSDNWQRDKWQQVVGTSGSIGALDNLSRALGRKQDWLCRDCFAQVENWLLQTGKVNKLDLLPPQRRAVFAGGFTIIAAIFEAFNLRRMQYAAGALREGVLYELNGRLHDQDSRDHGVAALVNRFSIDKQQANRVSATCQQLWLQVMVAWGIDKTIHRKMLDWASQIHEIGVNIAYNQNHKHGSYIVENADIDGFSRHQQRTLALLVRAHRQKFPMALFNALEPPTRARIFYIAVLLRVAVALNRSRADIALPALGLRPGKNKLALSIDNNWCQQHPLTVMDLQSEQRYLAAVSFELTLDLTLERS